MDRAEEILKAYLKEKAAKARAEKSALCPDEAVLSAYLNGALEETQARKVEEHICDCYFCLENLRAAYMADTLHRDGQLPASDERLIRKAKAVAKSGGGKKRLRKNMWFLGMAAAFASSFLVPRYFAQFLVAALILGLKWVFESEGARTLIMVLGSLRRRSPEKDEEEKDAVKKRF